ncbi:MAG: hypothetical protein BWX81_01964 [Spirochaetes bacterium ADurb.Bin110]|nr:MAG: hypothetical protein BWX81_01964 [Spirochaetes bacterium ADurb.Bin110]
MENTHFEMRQAIRALDPFDMPRKQYARDSEQL